MSILINFRPEESYIFWCHTNEFGISFHSDSSIGDRAPDAYIWFIYLIFVNAIFVKYFARGNSISCVCIVDTYRLIRIRRLRVNTMAWEGWGVKKETRVPPTVSTWVPLGVFTLETPCIYQHGFLGLCITWHIIHSMAYFNHRYRNMKNVTWH